MTEKRIFVLLHQIWSDLHYPEFYWEVLALAIILAISWWLSYRLRGRERTGVGGGSARHSLQTFGTGSLKRIAFPLFAVLLVLVLRQILQAMQWERLSLLYLAGPLLISWALIRILVYFLRCVFSNGGFLTRSERLITLTIWFGVLLNVTGVDDPVIEMLDRISFNIGTQRFTLWLLIYSAVTILVTLLVALWLASLLERRLVAVADMDGNVREVLSRLTKAVLSVIAVLCSLSLLGIDVTTLSVFGGALAVGLGFGLQKIASNYVSGFIILLDRSIRLGNLVAVDERTTGTVTQISTRYTVLRTLTGTEVIIPNEYLVSNIVRNLSFTDTRVRVEVRVSVAYDCNLEEAMALMVYAARQQPRVVTDPLPGVLITGFADSGINLELGFWLADPEAGTGQIRSDISLAIWKSFKAGGISIPFPQREVRILGAAAATA